MSIARSRRLVLAVFQRDRGRELVCVLGVVIVEWGCGDDRVGSDGAVGFSVGGPADAC